MTVKKAWVALDEPPKPSLGPKMELIEVPCERDGCLLVSVDDVVPGEAGGHSHHPEHDRACYHSLDIDRRGIRGVALRAFVAAAEAVSGLRRAGESERRGEGP